MFRYLFIYSAKVSIILIKALNYSLSKWKKKKKSGHLHLTSSFISLMALSVMSSLEVAIRPFKIGGIISASAVFIKSCTKAMKRSKEEI